jgi:hypothetical protein
VSVGGTTVEVVSVSTVVVGVEVVLVVAVFVVAVLVLCVEVVEVSVVPVDPGEGSLPPGSGLPCFANSSARPISSFAFE